VAVAKKMRISSKGLRNIVRITDNHAWKISVAPIRYIELTGRMFWRVILLYIRHSQDQRYKYDLRLYTPLLKWREAYQKADQFSAYFPR